LLEGLGQLALGAATSLGGTNDPGGYNQDILL